MRGLLCKLVYQSGLGDTDQKARERCKAFLLFMIPFAKVAILATPWVAGLRKGESADGLVKARMTSSEASDVDSIRAVVNIKLSSSVDQAQIEMCQAKMDGLFLVARLSLPVLLRNELDHSLGGDTFHFELVVK